MRVGANVAFIRPGAVGGSEEYTLRLLGAVHRLDLSDIELAVCGSADLLAARPHLVDLGYRSLGGPFRVQWSRLLAESTRLLAATADLDVVHHFGGRLPARRHGRDVLTIHDLQPLERPENFSRLKVAYLRWALPRSARAAQLVCVPSAWVAERVVDRLSLPAQRVRVVSSTWDEPSDAVDPDPGPDETVLTLLGDGPVILYPAVTHPHKNHLMLIEAVERLADRHADLQLVLTGGHGRAAASVAAAAGAARADVVRTGRIGAATLRKLMARADVLAFPSSYEGFGLPVIEAMHAGTPVVAADATALAGVVGSAGLLVAPDDPAGWADQLDAVLGDAALRERLVTAGRARAEAHAPSVAAARLVEVWRELA